MAKKWNVKVTANPDFCGIDAGGVQFAHGEAVIESERLAKWFKKHKGYKVTEIREAAAKGGKNAEGKSDDGGTDEAAKGSADGGNAND